MRISDWSSDVCSSDLSETEVAAAQWHADQSFLSRPARGSLLRCVLAPAVGGDTMFANMYLAFDLLSDGLKRMLEGQRDFHSLFGSRARVLNGRKPPTAEELARMGGAMQPLLITHPDNVHHSPFILHQAIELS